MKHLPTLPHFFSLMGPPPCLPQGPNEPAVLIMDKGVSGDHFLRV